MEAPSAAKILTWRPKALQDPNLEAPGRCKTLTWRPQRLNLEVQRPSEGLPRALRDVPEVEKPWFSLGKTMVLAYSLFAVL